MSLLRMAFMTLLSPVMGQTWRKRGFSSSYGVVTALSTITGKTLDCEVMAKDRRESKLWRGKEGSHAF